MALDLSACTFLGPALPEPFVRFDLERELTRARLLPKTSGAEGKYLQQKWAAYRRTLRELVATGGSVRVRNHVIEPLVALLGYDEMESAEKVLTREESREGEDGGYRLIGEDGTPSLRVWTTEFNADLDAPARRGAAYRYSPLRIAQRVLLASGERVGLLTNGVQLRILLSDPARPDSQVIIPIDPEWKRSRNVCDSFRFLLALCSPDGAKLVPELVDRARLKQSRVTKELRVQARQAVERFVQEVLDHPDNREVLAEHLDHSALARQLWREGLILIYRLLFLLKGEAGDDPARSFRFASTSLWRNTYSPSTALAPFARGILDDGAETGSLLEGGLQTLFRMFAEGIECTELRIKPLGGALFGDASTPLLSRLHWGERAVAHVIDRLLWTTAGRGRQSRERVHYGPLDVEDLGRVYEALLELEPGIADQPMCRLRRAKLEVVVPEAQGEQYRTQARHQRNPEDENDEADEAEDGAAETRGGRTRVEWVEAIPPGRFHLRVGLGRKASGSYYTPHTFVRFLIQETLGPQVAERSPEDAPNPAEILKLKVLDPAMGSGHFLVEACRFLGDALYEACRACDERATAAERRAEKAAEQNDQAAFQAASAEMEEYRRRVADLPDPNDELLEYLPSRSPERAESGYSRARALAICRRLVACHCLYGVDKNPLAVELAKLSLWLESQAEGLPLTFLDHRLVVGDSLTGPFWEKLILSPGTQEPIENLFQQNLLAKFTNALREAIRYVGFLEATVGVTLSEIEGKRTRKRDMDRALLPFRIVAAAWAGGVMVGPERCDDLAYEGLARAVGETGELPEHIDSDKLRAMIARGLGVDEVPGERDALRALATSGRCVPALSYDLTFPEVFYPTEVPHGRCGFHAVIGNPPWDEVQPRSVEFLANYSIGILDLSTVREREVLRERVLSDPAIAEVFASYLASFEHERAAYDSLFSYQKVRIEGDLAGRQLSMYRLFAERSVFLATQGGYTGIVVPAAFHANEGGAGIRRLYLAKAQLIYCYSFENRRKLFEIDSRFKFAAVVARCRGGTSDRFQCAFYIRDDEFLDRSVREQSRHNLTYTADFVRKTGGEYLTLLELRDTADAEVADVCFSSGRSVKGYLDDSKVTPNTSELPMLGPTVFYSPDEVIGSRDTRVPDVTSGLLARGFVPLHEGKTFHQFTDQWGASPKYIVRLTGLADRPRWYQLCRYYRLVYRTVARATDERTSIFAMLPPSVVTARNAASDITPADHPHIRSLVLIGLGNSFPFDYILRLMVQSAVSLFIVERVAMPAPLPDVLLAHSALRLSCNHAGYAALWREQLGDEWREPSKEPVTWPVLGTEEERWEVRSAIDAVVADAYGLNREQYDHVLRSFDRASGPNPYTDVCLAKFDELKASGFEAFTRQYDPYWDIPLVETLPQPVIEVPIPRDESSPTEAPSNLLGEPVPTDLYGSPQLPRRKKKGGRGRSRRSR